MSKADTIAIFGSNQTTAEGVITANETLNKLATDPAEGIIGAGFDAGTPQKAAINNGKLIGSVTQSPLMMGYKTIYTLVDICNKVNKQKLGIGFIRSLFDSMGSEIQNL